MVMTRTSKLANLWLARSEWVGVNTTGSSEEEEVRQEEKASFECWGRSPHTRAMLRRGDDANDLHFVAGC